MLQLLASAAVLWCTEMVAQSPDIVGSEQARPGLADAEFVSQAKDGSREALSALIYRYHGTVWAIAYARLRNRDAADDLAQEVLLVSLLHLGELTDPSRYAAWLSQITHHRSADWLRQKRRRSELLEAAQMLSSPKPACQPNAQQALEQEETQRALHDAILTLPEQQRIVILLKFTEGLNLEQISHRLEVHPTTVGRHLEKGLTLLRRRLAWLDEAELDRRGRNGIGAASSAASAASLAVAVAALAESHKASLAAAGGTVAPLAAAGQHALALSFSTGAKIMAIMKIGAATAAAGTLIGAAVYAALPATNPMAAPVTSAKPATSDEELIRAVRRECFPQEVCDYLLDEVPQLAVELNPGSQLPVATLYHSIDSQATPWLALVRKERSNGTRRIDLGGTSTKGPSGIISDTESYAPVIRTGTGNPQRAHAQITEPWPPGQEKRFVNITRWSAGDARIKPNPQGQYPLKMHNQFGQECVQQLVLVLPPGWAIADSNEAPAETREVGANRVLVWQKHVPSGNEGYTVVATLERVK